MSNSIRIKRRASTGDAGVSGVTLKNGELAYNEADDVLYYGYGVSGSNAAQIKPIAGNLPATTLSNYVNRTSAQSVAGVKTLTSLLNANGGIAVDTNKFTVADGSGNTAIAGTLAVTGITTLTGALNANGGINVNSGKFTVSSTDGSITTSNGSFIIDASGNITSAGNISSGEYTASPIAAAYIGNLNASKITAGEFDKDRLPEATATAKGAIELFSNTDQSVAANAVTATAGKTYGIQLNSAGQAVVNVPWSNTQTPVRDVTVDGHALDSGEALDLISGTNITLTESAGDVTIAAARRPVTAGGNTLANGETLAITAGSNITITESGGAVTIASVNDTNTFRPVTAGGNTLTSSETLAFTPGTNVTITENAGAVTINSSRATRATLGLDTDDDVVFGSLELSSGETSSSGEATIKGPATLTLDPRGHGDDTGTVVISGNLQVDGTTTTVNSTVVEIDDLAIELAHDATDSATINGAGLRFGTNSSGEAVHDFLYVHTATRMELSSGLKVAGGLQGTTLTSCTIDGGTF